MKKGCVVHAKTAAHTPHASSVGFIAVEVLHTSGLGLSRSSQRARHARIRHLLSERGSRCGATMVRTGARAIMQSCDRASYRTARSDAALPPIFWYSNFVEVRVRVPRSCETSKRYAWMVGGMVEGVRVAICACVVLCMCVWLVVGSG